MSACVVAILRYAEPMVSGRGRAVVVTIVVACATALSCGTSGGNGVPEAGAPGVDAADVLASEDVASPPEAAALDVVDVADVALVDGAAAVDGSLAHDAPSEEGSPSTDSAAGGEAGAIDGATDAAIVEAGPDAAAQDATVGLPSTAPCLTGGNVLYVNGGSGSFWFAGTQTDSTGSTWAVSAQNYTAKYDGALIEVHLPGSQSTDPWWYIGFDTSNFSQAVQLGTVYTNAAPYSATAGAAGLTIGYAQTCGSSGVGTFRIDQLVAQGDASEDTLIAFTAAFSATCAGNPVPLQGCVHYGP